MHLLSVSQYIGEVYLMLQSLSTQFAPFHIHLFLSSQAISVVISTQSEQYSDIIPVTLISYLAYGQLAYSEKLLSQSIGSIVSVSKLCSLSSILIRCL